MVKMIKKGNYNANIYKYNPLGIWDGTTYIVLFEAFGLYDTSYKSKGKYDTLDKAIKAAKRYVNKMNK